MILALMTTIAHEILRPVVVNAVADYGSDYKLFTSMDFAKAVSERFDCKLQDAPWAESVLVQLPYVRAGADGFHWIYNPEN